MAEDPDDKPDLSIYCLVLLLGMWFWLMVVVGVLTFLGMMP